MIKDYFILASRNLRKRKVRSGLTIIGIFISIATIFILISISIGLQASVEKEFNQLGVDKFFIYPGGQTGSVGNAAARLTSKDIKVIEQVQGVKDLSYFSAGSVEIKFINELRFSMLIAYPLDKSAVIQESISLKTQEGTLLKKGDVNKVDLGSSFAASSIFLKPVHAGDSITINGASFKVAGILQSIGNPNDDKAVFMSMDDYKSLFNNTDRVDEILVQAEPNLNVSDVATRVEKRLLSSRGLTKDTEDFTVLTPVQLLSSFGVVLNILTVFLLGIAGISLIVGGIGIANTMYTSVLERTKEIGIMKSVGAKNSDIMLIFLIESGVLGLVGGIIGVLIGMGVSEIIQIVAASALNSNIFQVSFPWYLFFGCIVFSFAIGGVFGILPAWRATKIKPVEALRYE